MSDDFIINGRWHKCQCGARWSDSDGGPCHWDCKECGGMIGEDDCSKKDNELCQDCQVKKDEWEKEENEQ